MDGSKTRTSGGKTLSSGGTVPLKPKEGLNGPPGPRESISRNASGVLLQKTQGPSTSLGMTVPGDGCDGAFCDCRGRVARGHMGGGDAIDPTLYLLRLLQVVVVGVAGPSGVVGVGAVG